MVALEFHHNGRRVCVAGRNAVGLLGASVHVQCVDEPGKMSRGYCCVDGVFGEEKSQDWYAAEGLAIGDEFLVRIVEPGGTARAVPRVGALHSPSSAPHWSGTSRGRQSPR